MAHFLRGYDYGFVLECLKRGWKCTKIVKHRSDLRILFTANDNTPMINRRSRSVCERPHSGV